MSMPLPAQLSHLQHPHRPQSRTVRTRRGPSSSSSPINSLSVELADSYQMVIQTMLQISPPQVLESAREQYSAYSLSVPTPSMSAMFTAMKTLNYMSANLPRLYNDSESIGYSDGEGKVQNVFDIGELLQCVGDALSGVVAQVGVDLVLFHGDVNMKHVSVKGDECGILYALLHIMRQILDTALVGDFFELGLVVTPDGGRPGTPSLREEAIEGRVSASPVNMDSLCCTVKIEHKYGTSSSSDARDDHGEDQDSYNRKQRSAPQFSNLLLRRLLRLIDAQFTIADNVQDGQIYEVNLILGKTAPSASTASKTLIPLSGNSILEEPSGSDMEPRVEQLLAFGETLKSRKIALYANSPSAFTRHITHCLTSWGMEMSHVFSDDRIENTMDEGVATPVQEARFSPAGAPADTKPEADSSAVSGPSGSEKEPQMSFVLIDDDVGILRERLHALRVEQNPLNLNARTRPSFLHRPRSSPQITRVRGQAAQTRPPPVTILHFASLSSLKATKDAIQSVASTYMNSTVPLPEVMIIPKPVGPKRLLTALHTAATRPAVDPFFLLTSSSPGTPGLPVPGSYPTPSEPSTNTQTSPSGTPYNRSSRPASSRSNVERSTKEHSFTTSLPSPSPLGIPDSVEYFPDPAGRLGASPSSGYLVSSPDGQPAGIFFHPRSKKNGSPPPEKSGVQTTIQRRGSSPQQLVKDAMPFAALHEASKTPSGTAEAKSTPTSTKAPEGSTAAGSTSQEGTPTPTLGRKSPPQSPRNEDTPSKKAIGKRPTHEKQDSIGKGTGKKGKALTPSDGNIVPPISVLIVDDNPINQTILSTFMKRKKIRYGIANNGKEAVEKWKTGGFHLILMDIRMPIMDGIEATREIRRLEKMSVTSEVVAAVTVRSPSDDLTPSSSSSNSESRSSASTSSPYRSSVIIVALTASSLQSDRVNALAAGCNDFLTKPVSLLWLNNKIIEWGSIKALQMWADLRPEAVRKMTRGQAAQARAIADRLHVPKRNKSQSLPKRPTMGEPTSTAIASSCADAFKPSPTVETSATAERLSRVSNSQDSEEWAPLPPIMPPGRRRSLKREHARDRSREPPPENGQTKTTGSLGCK
ncbi:SSK1 response regulator receiver [Agaricus bisporus var. bisporus H97]|uniref:SSK1 response regulator receiver n=1 Tax=Agaricus bisporus var. bisporus (strain H97 / ATCC MYA-4626 / FGSC 10389) TaxID=936046 RepID=UPI00029F52B2|nr:SSK1 response regulator receiver [Agaricus bisporus var. bisporus H97]EKV47906.1 SSK1 response regulator receiver [Agaricus bisporus var. bisporus H97]